VKQTKDEGRRMKDEKGSGTSVFIPHPSSFILFCIVFLTGCASEPFKRPPLPVLDHPNARKVQAEYLHKLANKFTTDDTVIISAPFHDDIAVLGVLKIDRAAGTFEMAGLNQMGLELFQIGGDKSGVIIRSAVPPLMEQKQVLLSIGEDVKRMYFDLAPSKESDFEVESKLVTYRDGDVIYEFGGDPAVLLEKRVNGFFGAKWRVRYYDYAESAGSLYPRGIVMDNGHYHYRIVVKNRAWQSDQ